jgi:hypothetical protein
VSRSENNTVRHSSEERVLCERFGPKKVTFMAVNLRGSSLEFRVVESWVVADRVWIVFTVQDVSLRQYTVTITIHFQFSGLELGVSAFSFSTGSGAGLSFTEEDEGTGVGRSVIGEGVGAVDTGAYVKTPHTSIKLQLS